MLNKNLHSFLRFIAIVCVLLVLLLFIANVTYRKSFKNEIKYKENFESALTSADPIPAGLDKSMVDGTYNEAIKQEDISGSIKANSTASYNKWKELSDNREKSQDEKETMIQSTKDKVKEYSGNVAKLNQTLYNMRNGDPQAAADIDKVGTFDATLYL